MIYEWLSRVSGDRDNDGIDCESHNNPNGYIPSAPVEPPVETSTCSADAETWRGLKVCDERPRDGYDRDAFGTSYSSLEGEIIAALPPTMKANGQVYTPYSCLAFDITPDGTAATDIEHIVALAETHDSSIADDRRRDIASDLDNLTIADPTVNRSEKSDRDAAEWMPARHGAWFAERVIQVKLEYGLSVDPFLENPAPPSPVHAGDGLVGQEARATVAAELLHEIAGPRRVGSSRPVLQEDEDDEDDQHDDVKHGGGSLSFRSFRRARRRAIRDSATSLQPRRRLDNRRAWTSLEPSAKR